MQQIAGVNTFPNLKVPEPFIMILAGDVGATNTRLGLFRPDGKSLIPVTIRSFKNDRYSGLDEVIDDFIPDSHDIEGACLGVAGPVFDGKASITNLNWEIDRTFLDQRFNPSPVFLINDVEATGFGISLLQPDDLLSINKGVVLDDAPAALIAAGTGLGEAILLSRGNTRVPFPTEAGHADFAPSNELQCEFLQHLWRTFHHVSWDRVLSGPGLLLIYKFLRDSKRGLEQNIIAEKMRAEDPSAVVADAALKGECELCIAALDFFGSLFGAEAGNLALRTLARGGVYLCGGIAPKLRLKLQDGTFMKAFVDKGRMRVFLESIPVHVVLNEHTGLFGAAKFAMLTMSTFSGT